MTPARRWATLVGALTFLLALTATPAGAAAPEVRWTSPSHADPVVRDRGPLRGEASDPDGGGIETITFTLEPDQAMDPEDPCRPSIREGDQVQTYAGSPAVSFAVGVDLPCNGTYVSTAVVRTRPAGPFDEQNQASAVLRFDAAVPPLPVSGLRGRAGSEPPPDDAAQEQVPPPPSEVDGVAPEDGDEDWVPQVVTLTWDANPEPDLLRYEVHRAAPDRPFRPIGSVEAGHTRYRDDVTGSRGGTYRYRVYSVREGPGSATEVVVAEEPAETSVDVPGRRTATSPDGTTTTTQAGSGSPSRDTAPGARSRGPVRRSPPTTRDTGFESTLDFGELPDPAPDVPEDEGPQADPGDDAAVARFDDDDPMPMDLLAPVAGSLVLIMGAVHLRHLAKRASEQPDPVDVVVEG